MTSYDILTMLLQKCTHYNDSRSLVCIRFRLSSRHIVSRLLMFVAFVNRVGWLVQSPISPAGWRDTCFSKVTDSNILKRNIAMNFQNKQSMWQIKQFLWIKVILNSSPIRWWWIRRLIHKLHKFEPNSMHQDVVSADTWRCWEPEVLRTFS